MQVCTCSCTRKPARRKACNKSRRTIHEGAALLGLQLGGGARQQRAEDGAKVAVHLRKEAGGSGMNQQAFASGVQAMTAAAMHRSKPW